jgi:hypothetical protein
MVGPTVELLGRRTETPEIILADRRTSAHRRDPFAVHDVEPRFDGPGKGPPDQNRDEPRFDGERQPRIKWAQKAGAVPEAVSRSARGTWFSAGRALASPN